MDFTAYECAHSLTDLQLANVKLALADDYFEGAVETVFEAFPWLTRDQAVDIVEWVVANV